jgi:N-acetylmuramoyl-L-alanine amidase
VRITLDPGHGGMDPGAVAGGVREADMVLDYGRTLRAVLAARGHEVYLSRQTDVLPSLVVRTDTANALGVDCFVSIHANAATNSTANGMQVFHFPGSERGRALALSIYDAATMEVAVETRWSGVFPDASPATGGRRLHVLRATRMPAVLVELGFLTHAGERAWLLQPAHREALCRAIADGIEDWAHMRAPWPGPPDVDMPPVLPTTDPVLPDRVEPILDRDAAALAVEQDLEARPGEPARRWLCRVLEFLGEHPDVPTKVRVPARLVRSMLDC